MAKPMKRQSVYPYTTKDVPGVNVHRFREARAWSLRELADHCRPALDHSTIRRLEHNLGYTQDTLERVAKALRVGVAEFFLPPEFGNFNQLPKDVRERLKQTILDAIAAHTLRSHKG